MRLQRGGRRRRVEVGQIVLHRQVRETGATVTVERTGPGSWVEQEPGIVEYRAACAEDWRNGGNGSRKPKGAKQ
jgi:hypothetical protein